MGFHHLGCETDGLKHCELRLRHSGNEITHFLPTVHLGRLDTKKVTAFLRYIYLVAKISLPVNLKI